MKTISRTLGVVAVSSLVLSGCSAASVRGTPATTPEQCEADWRQEVRGASTGVTSTSSLGAALASIFASAVASTAAKDAANQRFKSCLARFGINDVDAYLDGQYVPTSSIDGTAPRPQSPQSQPRGICPAGAGVLYSGATYCVADQ